MLDIATGLIIIGIIFSIYFWKKDKGKRNISIILTVLLFIIFGIASPDDQADINNEKENDDEEVNVIEKEESNDEEDILFGNGHPVYGGDFDSAEEYSKKFDKGLITFKNYGYSEDSIIHMPIVIDDVIRSLEIYLSRVDEDFNESEVLTLIKEYLPNDEVLEGYEEPVFSKYLTDNEDDDEVNKLIQYVSKKDAENSLGTINIIIYEKDDKAEVIQMTSQKPNSVGTRGSLIEEDWIPDY